MNDESEISSWLETAKREARGGGAQVVRVGKSAECLYSAVGRAHLSWYRDQMPQLLRDSRRLVLVMPDGSEHLVRDLDAGIDWLPAETCDWTATTLISSCMGALKKPDIVDTKDGERAYIVVPKKGNEPAFSVPNEDVLRRREERRLCEQRVQVRAFVEDLVQFYKDGL